MAILSYLASLTFIFDVLCHFRRSSGQMLHNVIYSVMCPSGNPACSYLGITRVLRKGVNDICYILVVTCGLSFVIRSRDSFVN